MDMNLTASHLLRMRWSLRSKLDSMAGKKTLNYSNSRTSINGVSCRVPCNCNTQNFSSIFFSYPFTYIPKRSVSFGAKKKSSQSEPILQSSMVKELVEEVSMDDDDDEGLILDDFGDEEIDGDDYLENGYIEEGPHVGDGCGGGGVSLAGTWWDKKALAIVDEVAESFAGEIGIYAFRTLVNGGIQVRIERLTNKSGSPSMIDIEDFSLAYKARLDEATVEESIPDNIFLEVSSPGVERVVRIPEDLERFRDRPLYVKYVSGVAASGATSEHDGVFRLLSVDLEANSCTWGLADVKINREKAGKGRPLSKKQREWRLETNFDSLLLVRLHSEI